VEWSCYFRVYVSENVLGVVALILLNQPWTKCLFSLVIGLGDCGDNMLQG